MASAPFQPLVLTHGGPLYVQKVEGMGERRIASKACVSMLEQLECAPPVGLPSQNGYKDCLDGSSLPSPSAARLEDTESERQMISPPAQQVLAGADARLSSAVQRFSSMGSAGSHERVQRSGGALSLQRADVMAMGALAVELFTRRLHHRSYADTGYWRSNAHDVAAPVQGFVLCCLDGNTPSIHKLMRHSIFAGPIRAAAAHLAHMDDGAGVGGSSSSSKLASALQDLLDGPHSLGAFARQGVLQLCAPSVLRLVEEAALRDYASDSASPGQRHGAEASLSTVEAAAEALRGLVQRLPRSLAIQGPLQLWAALLGGHAAALGRTYAGSVQARVQPLVQAELMQPARLKRLAQAVGLSAYLDSAHAALLSTVCTGASVAGKPAAGQVMQLAIQVWYIRDRPLLPPHHGAPVCPHVRDAWP